MTPEDTTRLVDIDWHPSVRKIRQFAACFAVFALTMTWFAGVVYMPWTSVVAGLVVLGSWVAPWLIQPLYVALMLITLPIGLIVGEAALVIIFVGVFCPIGLLFRLMGRDALQRRIDRKSVSYWEESQREQPKKNYLRRY